MVFCFDPLCFGTCCMPKPNMYQACGFFTHLENELEWRLCPCQEAAALCIRQVRDRQ